MKIESFLEWARAEPRVVGVVVTGSRGRSALVHEGSDWDLRVLVPEGEEDFAAHLLTPHGSPLEIAAMPVSELERCPDWDRYSYAHATVAVDKLDGAVTRLVDQVGTLSSEESAVRSRAALDAYLNSLHRSLGSARLGLRLESRLDACESISWLLEALFSVERRLRPFNKYLRWELEPIRLPIGRPPRCRRRSKRC